MARSARPTTSQPARATLAPASPELEAELLRYATQIDEASGWGCRPILWYVAPRVDDEPERGIIELEGLSVPDALRGFRARAGWHALGSWSAGNAFHGDESTWGRQPAGRIRVTHVQHRSGSAVSLLRSSDDDAARVIEGPPVGRIDDYTRRALRMAAPPPTTTTLELFALEWLAAIIDELPRSWHEAATLHPAAPPAGGDLTPLGQLLAEDVTWTRLRRAACDGNLRIPGMTRSLARWHDDGSFSRDLLGAWPPLAALLDAVIDVLPASTAASVVDVLAGWGLWAGGR